MKIDKLAKIAIARLALWMVRGLVRLLLLIPVGQAEHESRLVLADLVEDVWNAAH